MRIRLGVFVGCMLFLAYGSRAEHGKGNQSVPASGTSASNASDTHRMDDAALFPAVSETCGYRSRDEWRAAFQTAVERGEIPDPTLTSPPAVAPRAIRAGGGACAPVPQTSDIFLFEDSAGTLLTNFSEGQLDSLMTSAANALLVAEGDNFDFIGFWVSFVPHHQIGAAFYRGIENNVAGIGLPIFNDRPFIGLAGDNVEGYIMMWNINDGLWAPGTAGNFASFTRLVFAQEIEHRWGVFLPNLLDGRSMQGNNVCGRFFHWNRQIDGQGSGMEMREWIGSSPAVLGGNCVSFAPDECFNSDIGGVFSYTDLYLMGFVSPAEMDAGNSELRYMDAGCNSPYNGFISTFSSADIVASAGTRNPSSAASQHDYHIGWIMFHQPGDPPNATELDKAVGILAQQSIDFDFSTLGVGTLNTTLQGDCTFTVKFSQRPTPGGENIASNIDWTDDDPNVVVADDFISDARPVNSVRWWGSNLGEAAPPICGDNAVNRPSEDCDGTDDTACPGQCQADCTCPAGPACGPGAGDCCVANGTPGCDDEACCNMVCDCDPFCCDIAWDIFCAGPNDEVPGCSALDLCPDCFAENQPSTAPQYRPVPRVEYGTTLADRDASVAGKPASLQPPDTTTTANAGPGLFVNGDFETGDFTGWTRIDAGSGTFVINDGTLVPGSGDGPLAPCQGNFSAVTDQTNPGLHTLFQDVTIPALAGTATLHWIDMIRNHNGAFLDPNQEFRVEVWDPNTNAVLASLFSTDPGDLALQNCTARSADISAFIGQTVRIAFTEEDDQFFFNVHVDDVRIEIIDAQIFASDPQGANLGTVDPATGLFTIIGPFVGAAFNVTEIEWDPTGTTLYATTGGGSSAIHTVDPTTGTILTTVIHAGGALNGLEFDASGLLLGTFIPSPGNPSDLVLVDTNTGVLVTVGGTGFSNIGGLAFDAGFTTLFGITSGGAAIPPTLLNVNPATGAAAAIAAVSVAVEMSSLEFTPGGQLVAGGADGILYEIDTVTGVATAVGPLVNAGKVSGMSVKPGGAIPPGVPKPDGWFISFHEPLVEGLPPQPPLGLYFCDEADVQVSTTASPSCDSHTVREYVVDLVSCCLVHANVDSRTGLIPAQIDGFFEEECFAYAIDIQAVVGHRFVDDGFGACIEESTGESWDEDVWGWHSTFTEIGAAFGLGPALQTVVSMSGVEWLYGPWGPVDITCGQRNMAFELITDTPNAEDPDADGDGVPDVCNISPPEIRFFPIRSAPLGSPVGTIGDPVTPVFDGALGCWEVFVPGGVGAEVDLDLQAFGWGNAVGSPTLGAIVATVVSDGYSNGQGGDLNPKGWPGSPLDGAYQAILACNGDGSPCTGPFDPTCDSGANGSCVDNPDWVMPQCASDLPAMDTVTLDYAWATAAQNDCNTDDGLVKTMGGLILEVPENAFGTYVIDLDPDPNNSFMTSGAGTPIADLTLTPACITTLCQKAAPPAIDCWATACDGSTQYDFGQNVIPADFFGPGSDPFDGVVALGGASGGVDTQIQRLDGVCFDGSLPVTRTTDIEIVQLDLISCDPITVTFNGGQDPEEWMVAVQLVAPQTQGTLTAIKLDDDGGTYTADIPVNAQFVFERVSDGQTEGPLSAGNISLSTTVPAPWRQSGCTGPCAAAGFCPGLTTDPNGDPCCEPTCHEGPAPGHEHCTVPPDCPACPPPVEPPIRAPAPHEILKNRYISIDPRGASGNNPSSHHIRVMVDSSEVNGLLLPGNPWWATEPVNGTGLSPAVCISVLSNDKPAVEPDWSACPTVHLTGCSIVPTTTYAIAVEAGGNLSAEVLLDTQAKPGVKWHGDCVGSFDGVVWTAPNATTNIDDAVAGIKTFQDPTKLPGCGSPPCNATHLSVTDVHPNLNGTEPNLIVSIADVFVIILGFQGQEYPGVDLTMCDDE